MYARPLHRGQPLTFGVSGMLWRASLIMFDRETRSLWSHVSGVAVAGSLGGTKLAMLPAVQTTWGLWRANHPDTEVLEKPRGRSPGGPHPFEADVVLGLLLDRQAFAFPFAALRRAPLAHATVANLPLLVVYIGRAATAVAFRRQAGGRVLTFRDLREERGRWYMEDQETGSRWNALTGEAADGRLAGEHLPPLPATQAFLGSWQALFPGGRLCRPD